MTAKKQDERQVRVTPTTTITIVIGDVEVVLTGLEAAALEAQLSDALYENGVY